MSTVEESVCSVTKHKKLDSRCGTSEPTDWSSSTTPTSDTRDPVYVVPTADTSRFSSASLRTQDLLGPPSRRFDNLDSTARQATPDQVHFFFKVLLSYSFFLFFHVILKYLYTIENPAITIKGYHLITIMILE